MSSYDIENLISTSSTKLPSPEPNMIPIFGLKSVLFLEILLCF